MTEPLNLELSERERDALRALLAHLADGDLNGAAYIVNTGRAFEIEAVRAKLDALR